MSKKARARALGYLETGWNISSKTVMRRRRRGEDRCEEDPEDPQKAGYKSRHAARKPLLTERIKFLRMEFTTSPLNWSQVMFQTELTFRLVCVRGDY